MEFIENSPEGVIIFSLDSVLAMSSLPGHVLEAILKVFEQLPQRIILKYEDDLQNLPKNVMTRKWIPQRDILCKVKIYSNTLMDNRKIKF